MEHDGSTWLGAVPVCRSMPIIGGVRVSHCPSVAMTGPRSKPVIPASAISATFCDIRKHQSANWPTSTRNIAIIIVPGARWRAAGSEIRARVRKSCLSHRPCLSSRQSRGGDRTVRTEPSAASRVAIMSWPALLGWKGSFASWWPKWSGETCPNSSLRKWNRPWPRRSYAPIRSSCGKAASPESPRPSHIASCAWPRIISKPIGTSLSRSKRLPPSPMSAHEPSFIISENCTARRRCNI